MLPVRPPFGDDHQHLWSWATEGPSGPFSRWPWDRTHSSALQLGKAWLREVRHVTQGHAAARG